MEDNYYEVENQKVVEEDPIKQVKVWKGILLFLIGFIGLSFVYTGLFLLANLFFELDPEKPTKLYYQVDGVLQFATYAIAILITFLLLGVPTIKLIFSKYKLGSKYGKGAMYGGILLGAQTIYSILSTAIFGEIDANVNQNTIIELTRNAPLLMGIATVIFAPFFEEITYRYGLFGSIYKKNRILAYIASLTIFGLIHFDFTCFTSGNIDLIKVELINLPSYLIAGFILCFAYDKEKTLITPIMAHAMNNFVAFTQILMFYM